MSRKPATLQETQESYERKFDCTICFCARLEMVSGMCQHRICARCLYDEDNHIRSAFYRCPICQLPFAFPQTRPEIPDDNKELMRCLGVRTCPNQDKGCTYEMWEWEMEDHLRSCTWKSSQRTSLSATPTPPRPKRNESERIVRRYRTRSRPYNFRHLKA